MTSFCPHDRPMGNKPQNRISIAWQLDFIEVFNQNKYPKQNKIEKKYTTDSNQHDLDFTFTIQYTMLHMQM